MRRPYLGNQIHFGPSVSSINPSRSGPPADRPRVESTTSVFFRCFSFPVIWRTIGTRLTSRTAGRAERDRPNRCGSRLSFRGYTCPFRARFPRGKFHCQVDSRFVFLFSRWCCVFCHASTPAMARGVGQGRRGFGRRSAPLTREHGMRRLRLAKTEPGMPLRPEPAEHLPARFRGAGSQERCSPLGLSSSAFTTASRKVRAVSCESGNESRGCPGHHCFGAGDPSGSLRLRITSAGLISVLSTKPCRALMVARCCLRAASITSLVVSLRWTAKLPISTHPMGRVAFSGWLHPASTIPARS